VDWLLWQCGNCREACVIFHTKCHKKRPFRIFFEIFVWKAAEAFLSQSAIFVWNAAEAFLSQFAPDQDTRFLVVIQDEKNSFG
jgi:hypothetical protein